MIARAGNAPNARICRMCAMASFLLEQHRQHAAFAGGVERALLREQQILQCLKSRVFYVFGNLLRRG